MCVTVCCNVIVFLFFHTEYLTAVRAKVGQVVCLLFCYDREFSNREADGGGKREREREREQALVNLRSSLSIVVW